MISLTPPRPLSPPGPLYTAGGFLWWYLDLTDDSGDGLVLIWSFNLPFLPGIASAARAGRPTIPADHPSVNVVIYRDGKPDFYLLQTADPQTVHWDGESWELGGLTARVVTDEQLTLSVELDCAVPNSSDRLIGQITLTGQPRQGGGDGEAAPEHEWTPLAVVAHASASLSCGSRQWDISGRAYFDRNLGQRPMHTLGIDRWWWFRLALPDRELIGYHLIPIDRSEQTRSLCLSIAADGTTTTAEDARFVMSGWRRSLLGPSWPATLTLTPPGDEPVVIHLAHLVDNGPFYQRFQIQARVGGVLVRGFAEHVLPDRIDRAWSRPFVKMAVHQHDGGNSMWLPLFCGPRTGRLSRLLGLQGTPAQIPARQP
ncbi:MAG: carotenoid 1,2-hydratase [Myxococcota bacterium]